MHKAFDYVYIDFPWKIEKQATMKYEKYTNKEIDTKRTSKISHWFRSLAKCFISTCFPNQPMYMHQ